MSAITTNGNGKKQITVTELANELKISVEDVKTALLSPELSSDAPLTATKADQIRRAYQSLKNPVTASLVTSEELSNSELKENLAEVANYTRSPQYMVKALAKVLYEKQAMNAYAEGQQQAELKYALDQIQEQGRIDKEQEILQKSIKKTDSELQDLIGDKEYYNTRNTLERMGLGSIMSNNFSKTYEQIKLEDEARQLAIQKLSKGEELTIEEKKIASIQFLLSLNPNQK